MHNSTLKSSNSNINVISSSYTHEQFIPEEAYLYFPSPSTTSSSKLHRSLFEGAIFYTQLENKAITEIYPKLKPETQKHITKSDIMRFLLHNCNSSQKTIISLEKYIFLKQSILTYPLSSPPESIIHFLNRGVVYSFGRDHNFRPNIIIDIINVLKCSKVMSKDFIVKALFYFLHFVIEYLLLPGQVEQWNVIMNTNGKSVEYDDEFKYVFNILTDCFPQRLHMLFIYNCDNIGCFMWNFFKIALENKTQVNNQVVILRQDKAHNNSNAKSIFDYIHEEQLEKKFGGLEDNVTHNYFPPYVDNKKHKRYYKNDEIDCRRKIIDKDSYIDKMKREGQYYKVNRNIYAGNIQSNNDNNIGQLCNSIKGISNKTIEVSTAETVKHEKPTDNNNNNTNMLKEQEQEDVIKDILPPLMMQEIIIEHPYENEQISNGTCSFLCGSSSSSVVNKQHHHNYNQCILF